MTNNPSLVSHVLGGGVMADKPIIFSAPMVNALLAGRKTQTRREHPPEPRFKPDGCRPAGLEDCTRWWDYWALDRPDVHRFKLPYAVGDRLYVREHWRVSKRWDETAPRDLKPRTLTVAFEAGGSIANQDSLNDWRAVDWPSRPDVIPWIGRFRQAMHMPRWASRLTLTVTDVRVQRLQEISAADSIAEGVQCGTCEFMNTSACNGRGCFASIAAFQALWDSLHGTGAWEANPWVAAYSFTVQRGNIDTQGGPQ